MNTSRSRNHILFITITAVFTAMVFVFTAFVNIKLPLGAGGLIHLGNVPLFICAILFGRKSGAVAGALGMAMFDLISGWTAWAPFTFVIVGLMGYFIGVITEKRRSLPWYGLSFVVAAVIKVVGYYIAEVLLYGNFVAPILSIPGNLIQIAVASVIVLMVIKPIEKPARKVGLTVCTR